VAVGSVGSPNSRSDGRERPPRLWVAWLVVARVTVETFYGEMDLFVEQYDGLRAELERAGHDVVVRRRPEQKSLEQITQDVALHVAGNIDAYVEGAIIGAVVKWLRGKARIGPRRGRARVARLYGPDGQVLREVELPAAPDDSS
jgi:hypothetical protein